MFCFSLYINNIFYRIYSIQNCSNFRPWSNRSYVIDRWMNDVVDKPYFCNIFLVVSFCTLRSRSHPLLDKNPPVLVEKKHVMLSWLSSNNKSE
jgi:hypothetical protein